MIPTPLSVSVVVLAVPNRDSHARCFASIETSDIGKDYVVRYQPEYLPAREHWYQTHLFAARMPTDLVIVLEDDCMVNRHILWNVGTWLWTKNAEFKAGWLYNPGGRAHRDEWYDGPSEWSGTVGVVYRTQDLAVIVDRAWTRVKNGEVWDLCISWAACKLGRIRMHMPALVEHMDEFQSTVGNQPAVGVRTSYGTYDETWRRPNWHRHGFLDEYGRPATP